MRPISGATTTTTSLAPIAAVPFTGANRSSWHSPIPYLFGGLAAMLGLIAFALLILACSYWKLSGQLQSEENRDLENAEGDESKQKETVKVYEEKILVIMAGDEKPTFLATPVCPKSSSFVDGVGNHSDKDLKNHLSCQKLDKEIENDNVQSVTTPSQTRESEETQQQTQRQ